MSDLKSLIPDLPRRAWIILAGDGISAVGEGMILPFTIIYLHRVRGIEIELAGAALSLIALVGLGVGPAAGVLVDRVGPRRVVVAALVVSAAGTLSYIPVRVAWQAFAAAAIVGTGHALFWPSIQSLLAGVVEPHHRSAVFSVHYAMLNAGIGVGGIVGGFVANLSSPSSFETLYLVDAITFIPGIVLLTFFLRAVGGAPPPSPESESLRGGYRQVLSDRVFLRLWALMAFLVMIGYAQLQSAFPAYVTDPRGGAQTTRVVGFAFAANTFTIVVMQLFALKGLTGRRRTRGIVVLCALWAMCWLLTFVAGWFSGFGAATFFVLALVAFAVGETLMSPTIPAMVNDLAPERLRGRYNAMNAFAWSGGESLGPVIAGLFLGAGLARPLFLLLIAACVVAAFGAIRLERHLPSGTNLVTSDAEVSPA